MSNDGERQRLDEILISQGLVSEAQIREALLRQKAHGGKVGSQLLYHRYIDEAGLVRALSLQFGCEGIVLSNIEIEPTVIEMVPQKVAVARTIVPFDFDPGSNVLKVACENPNDEGLAEELAFVAEGKTVKFYVAAELALNTAISRYYLGEDVSLDASLSIQIPDEATDTGQIKIPAGVLAESGEPKREAMLLVTDEEYCGSLVQSILERDNYDVVVTDSADDALALIGERKFHTVFIKDTVPGDYLDLIDRLRKRSPRTRVRYYETAADLLINVGAFATEGDILVKNLDLFTSMMSTATRLPDNHSGRVGLYADRLCRRLGLPDKDRLQVVSAAYLHDLAKFHYSADQTKDYRRMIQLSTKLLQSLNYPPVLVEMLRSMYVDLGGRFTKRLPIEALGGNILTIVDLFCENVSPVERIGLDKFDAIKKKFRDLIGRLFMTEVAEAFISMIQEEILTQQTSLHVAQVMLFAQPPASVTAFHLRLRNEGFRTMTPGTVEVFVDLYERSRPDILVLAAPGGAADVNGFINELASQGIDFEHTPTFVLVDAGTVGAVTELLERGIEDILINDGSLDLLVVKMQKIQSLLQSRQAERAAEVQKAGASGRLADMNLIDLLQALGPSRKTARITVISGKNQSERLTLYLDEGAIIFAEYGELQGAEAVYETLGWADGFWTVEPLGRASLPDPNNELPNESILMEGCRLLDERLHQGHLF